jgi:tetratricopeptide (TPR) repeat protein
MPGSQSNSYTKYDFNAIPQTPAMNTDVEEGTTVLTRDGYGPSVGGMNEDEGTTVLARDGHGPSVGGMNEDEGTTVLARDGHGPSVGGMNEDEGTTVLTRDGYEPAVGGMNEDEGTTVLSRDGYGSGDGSHSQVGVNGQPGYGPDFSGQQGFKTGAPYNENRVVMPEQPKTDNGNKDDILIKKAGEKKKKSKGAKVALISIPIVVVLVIGALAFIFIPKFRNYNSAEELLDQGKVDEAVDMYKDLGKFKDSVDKANGGAYYEYAQVLEKNGDNISAAQYYEKSSKYGYSDSTDKYKQCYYNAALDQMSQDSYDEAIDSFTKASDYNDASDKVIECKYKKAQDLIGKNSYDDAITVLTEIEDYSDAKTLLSQCYYNKAAELFDAKNYDDAYNMYMSSEYDDYVAKANECLYTKAEEYYAAENYKSALESYKKIDNDYKDCTAEIDKCYKSLGSQAYKNKEYKEAVEYFESITTMDVTKSINKSKVAYIKANKTASNSTTMKYLGELRYAGNSSGQKLYADIIKWDINSYVNNGEKDYDNQASEIKGEGDIYIHTSFSCSDDATMNIRGYIVYSDGNTSDSISFSDPVVNDWSTWIKITGDSAPKGTTYLYLVNESTDETIEVFPFTIK